MPLAIKTPYGCLAVEAHRLGWPVVYRADLTLHDRNMLRSSDAPAEFVWVIRETGTYIIPRDPLEIRTSPSYRFRVRDTWLSFARTHHRCYEGQHKRWYIFEADKLYHVTFDVIEHWLTAGKADGPLLQYPIQQIMSVTQNDVAQLLAPGQQSFT